MGISKRGCFQPLFYFLYQKLQIKRQKLQIAQKRGKMRYYADVNRGHHPKENELRKREVIKMTVVLTTAVIAVTVVAAMAIICRPF